MEAETETELCSDVLPRWGERQRAKGSKKGAITDIVEGTGAQAELREAGLAKAVVDSAPDKGEEVRMRVVRNARNPRLIECVYWDQSGIERKVLVRVGDNRNFRPKMQLRAQPGASEGGPWKLVGRRPRLPGRW